MFGLFGGQTEGSIKLGMFCWNSTVNFARCDGAPSCWKPNSSPHSWRCLAEASSAAAFTVVSSVYFGSFIDKVYLGLACLGYCHWYHHTFAEVLAIFDETITWYCFPHCVFCRVELLSFILSHHKSNKNICTKFAHVTQKWLYFNVRYSF